MTKRAVVADIDGTQIREDVPKDQYTTEDLNHAQALKTELEALSDRGVLIVHATNRMAELVLEDIGLLAKPDYITCSASTRILKYDRETGTITDDPDYDALVQSCNFDPEVCKAQADAFDELVMTAPINQTPRKVSYTFKPGTPVTRRKEIQAALQTQQPEGITVFMVEDRDNHIIDFLPKFCTKAAVLDFVMQKEGIRPENVVAFGNSNNDIPLLRKDFKCVAVGDSRPSLMKHFEDMKAAGSTTHVIAPFPSTRGVLWGLRHFGVTG